MAADRRVLVVACMLFCVLARPSLAATESDRLQHGRWRLETPLGTATGPCLVVENAGEDAGDSWRCEIAMAEGGAWPSPEDVLHRRGRGWTITATPDGSFVKPWSEPWRQLGPAAGQAFASMLREWNGAAAAAARTTERHRWRLRESTRPEPVILDDWAGLPDAWRPPGEGVGDGGVLRRRLTARGRGRGGDGLVLDLRWEGDDLVATSARWPGRVVLIKTGAEPVDVPPEAFLPLWPLAEFLQ